MEKTNLKKELLEYLKVIVTTVLITLVVLYFVQVSRVVGSSMEPNYHNGNIVLVNKRFYPISCCKYGDVVVAKADFGFGSEQIIKRVIGLPGDTISQKGSTLYRNGKALKEDYINEVMDNDNFSVTVEEGHVFIMGDNRNDSADSRVLGSVDYNDIVGNVFLKLF